MRRLIANLLVGTVAALAVGLGLAQLTWRGWAHTFDSAIYARSLWGLAFGHGYNPVVELHAMSVHFNLVLMPLVPFARLFDPALLLVVLQAVAWGATVALMGHEFRRSIDPDANDVWGGLAASTAAAVLMVMTPLVANPFLFDLRPDLCAVPLATAGLLRARRLGDWDRGAVALLLSSLLAREEMMMLAVAALATTPWGAGILSRWRLRLTGIVIALGWWAFYWFGVRRMIGDGSYAIAQEVAGDFFDSELTLLQYAGYKLEIVVAFALSMGGLSLLGWRWLGAALPGLGLLLMMHRMQPLVLNFHYSVFVAPAVLVASVDGFARLLEIRKRRPWVTGGVVVAGLIAFSLSSAMPGGGRFREDNFALLVTDGDGGLETEDVALLEQMHTLVAQIDDDEGAAVPYPLAAPLAARETILLVERFEERGLTDQIDRVSWVGLPGRAWRTLGPPLVHDHDFKVVGLVARRLALLHRAPGVVDASIVAQLVGQNACESSERTWNASGVVLCATQRLGDGRVALLLRRVAESNTRLATAMRVGENTVPAMIADGLLRLDQIPLETPVVAISATPLPPGEFEVGLFADGQFVEPSAR